MNTLNKLMYKMASNKMNKRAFQPMPGGQPPMDPAMMGGQPPMDPAMAGGDPMSIPLSALTVGDFAGLMMEILTGADAAMAGGQPPMDPAMADGGMPMDPAMMAPPPAEGESDSVSNKELSSKIDILMEALGVPTEASSPSVPQGPAAGPAPVAPGMEVAASDKTSKVSDLLNKLAQLRV